MINLSQIDKKALILAAIVSAIIIYSDFNFLIKSQGQGIKNLEKKISKLNQDIDTLNKGLVRFQKEKKEEVELPAPKKFVFQDHIPLMLQDITTLADKNKIRITQIRQAKEIIKAKDSKSAKPPVENLIPLVINLDLSGDYHNFGKFINALENAPYFVSFEEIRILISSSDYLQQAIVLVLKTYVSK